jgi:hypothetical protein
MDFSFSSHIFTYGSFLSSPFTLFIGCSHFCSSLFAPVINNAHFFIINHHYSSSSWSSLFLWVSHLERSYLLPVGHAHM